MDPRESRTFGTPCSASAPTTGPSSTGLTEDDATPRESPPRTAATSADAPSQAMHPLAGMLPGFIAIVSLAALFAVLAAGTGMDRAVGRFDQRVSTAIGDLVPTWLLHVAATVTHLGDPPVLVAVVCVVGAALAGWRRWGLFVVWLVATAGNGVLTRSLKAVFARARPVHDEPFAVADGFAFPSGHTTGALVVWGMLAWLVTRLAPPRWHAPALIAAACIAIATAASRVVLRVHWPSDVLAGAAAGGAWLLVCVSSAEIAWRWSERRRQH